VQLVCQGYLVLGALLVHVQCRSHQACDFGSRVREREQPCGSCVISAPPHVDTAACDVRVSYSRPVLLRHAHARRTPLAAYQACVSIVFVAARRPGSEGRSQFGTRAGALLSLFVYGSQRTEFTTKKK